MNWERCFRREGAQQGFDLRMAAHRLAQAGVQVIEDGDPHRKVRIRRRQTEEEGVDETATRMAERSRAGNRKG